MNYKILLAMTMSSVTAAAVADTAADTTAAGSHGVLEEITVTAQRRQQSLNDVPITVSVANAEQLSTAAVVQSTQLAQITPGLVIDSIASFTQTYIRGVGSEFVQPGTNQSVPTYIDGVVVVSPTGQDMNLADVERIEVLKGPQGTLFGRNAAGGAINIVTKTPSDTFGGKVSIGTGNLHSHIASLYLTGPLAPDLKGSVAAYESDRSGWYDNLAAPYANKGDKQYGGRVKLLYAPAGGFEAELGAFVEQFYNGENGAYHQLQPNSVGAEFGGVGSAQPGTVYNDSTGKNYPEWGLRHHTAGASVRLKVPLPFADLVSITGYRSSLDHLGSEYDATSAPLAWFYADQPEKTTTEEVQLISNSHTPVEWITGLYYFNDSSGYDPLRVPGAGPGGLTLTQSDGRQRSYAVYGQARYAATEQFGITFGLRYSHDEAIFNGAAVDGVAVLPGQNHDWNNLSPKLTFDYKIDKTLLYFTASEGYKAGSYNLSNLSDVGPVNPEKLYAIEVGAKTELGGIAQLNVAAFGYDYKDLQVSFVPNNNDPTSLANAANSRIAGIEFDGVVKPTEQLRIDGGMSFLPVAKYKDFPGGTAYVDNATITPAPAPFGPFGYSVLKQDFSGNRLAHAPRVTANLGASYTWNLPVGDFAASTNVHYRSYEYFAPQNSADTTDGSVTLVSAKLGYTSPDGHWTASLWGQNLTDKHYFSSILQTSLGTIGVYALPRTYGGTLAYQF